MFTGKYKLQGVELTFFHTEPYWALAPETQGTWESRKGSYGIFQEHQLRKKEKEKGKKEKKKKEQETRFFTQLMFLIGLPLEHKRNFMLELLANILETCKNDLQGL